MFDNCSACCINRSVLIFRQQCCNEQTWMRSNRLQLNTAKTEVIWRASSRRQHQIPQTPLTVGSDTVVLVCVVRDLGIYLDSSADADTRCKDCVKLLCGVTADPERQTVFVKTDSADSGRVTRPDQTRLWLRHIGRTSCQPTRQTAVGTECRGATHLWSTKKIRPRDAAASRVALAASARTHYLPAGDTCVSLSAQHGATLSCSLAKSREHRRLSTAIALGINVWTYRSAHCTLDNRRPCVLCDRSSGVEHLDTVRAVLWVTHSFSTSPEDWTVFTLLPRLTISVFAQ